MTKDSRGTKPMASTEKTSTPSSTLTQKEKRMQGNMLLKELFKVTRPMAPDKN